MYSWFECRSCKFSTGMCDTAKQAARMWNNMYEENAELVQKHARARTLPAIKLLPKRQIEHVYVHKHEEIFNTVGSLPSACVTAVLTYLYIYLGMGPLWAAIAGVHSGILFHLLRCVLPNTKTLTKNANEKSATTAQKSS